MFRHRKTAVSGFLGGCVHGNVPVVPNRIAALDSGLTEEMRARRSTLRRLILFLRYAYRWRAVCRRYSNSSNATIFRRPPKTTLSFAFSAMAHGILCSSERAVDGCEAKSGKKSTERLYRNCACIIRSRLPRCKQISGLFWSAQMSVVQVKRK